MNIEDINEQKIKVEVELDSLKEIFYTNDGNLLKETKELALKVFKYLRDYIEDIEFDIENDLN